MPKSEIEYRRAVADAKKDGQEFWAEKTKVLTKCASDIAFRTKNPGACALPVESASIGLPLPGQRSVDEIFDSKWFGWCVGLATIAEARKNRCLPSK